MVIENRKKRGRYVKEGGREGRREERRERGRKGRREGGKEGGREGRREGGREGRREGGREGTHLSSDSCQRTSPTIWPAPLCRAFRSSSDLSYSLVRSFSSSRTSRI